MKRLLVLMFIIIGFGFCANAQSKSYEFYCCTDINYVINKSGTTKVSELMFEGVARVAQDRIVSQKNSTFKSFVLISYCWDFRGRIYNITDDLHKYRVEYTDEDGDKYSEEIEVLPRTFSHMIPQYILQPVKIKVYELQ